MKEFEYIISKIIYVISFIIAVFTEVGIINRIAIVALFLSSQFIIKISIHDYLMIKEMKKYRPISWLHQPDLCFRFIVAFTAFYYSLYLNIRYDIALTILCFILYNFWFYKIIKRGPTEEDKASAMFLTHINDFMKDE